MRIGVDRLLGALHVLVYIAEQRQGHRPVGVERKSKLRIEQAHVDALVVGHGGSEREQRLGGASTRRGDHGLRLAASLGIGKGRGDQRIVVAAIEESSIDFRGLRAAAAAFKKIAIGLHHPERGACLLVGFFVKSLGPDGIAEVIGNQGGMESLEIGEALVAVELVEGLQRPRQLAFARMGPGDEQRGRQFAHGGVGGGGKVPARVLIVADAIVAQAQHDAGHALLAVEAEHAHCEFLGHLDVALRQFQQEHALDQNRIAGVLRKGAGEVIGSDVVVAQFAGGEPREIVAGKRNLAWRLQGAGGGNGPAHGKGGKDGAKGNVRHGNPFHGTGGPAQPRRDSSAQNEVFWRSPQPQKRRGARALEPARLPLIPVWAVTG